VEYLNANNLVTCYTSLVDYNSDCVKTWSLISKKGLQGSEKNNKQQYGFPCRGKARIAKRDFPLIIL
jgi:hypothetical protein